MCSCTKVLMKIVTLHSVQDVGEFCSMLRDNFFRIGRELANVMHFHGLLKCLVKLHKSGIHAVFQAPRCTGTASLLAKLSIPSLHQVLLQKLLVFVFLSIHRSASSLFQDCFVLLAQIPLADRIVTRGHLHNLLRIPFLPNPAGR